MPALPKADAAAAEDIRDIRGTVAIPYSWMWMVYALGGLAAVAAAYAAWRAWKNRKPVHVKLPHEIAMERLRAAGVLMVPGKAREYSIAVSNAIRDYIEARFPVRAARRTTEEFLHDLLAKEGSPLAVYSSALGDFLNHCDLAKFARWSLSQPEMQSMQESAQRFVEETKPVEGKAVAPKPQPPAKGA